MFFRELGATANSARPRHRNMTGACAVRLARLTLRQWNQEICVPAVLLIALPEISSAVRPLTDLAYAPIGAWNHLAATTRWGPTDLICHPNSLPPVYARTTTATVSADDRLTWDIGPTLELPGL